MSLPAEKPKFYSVLPKKNVIISQRGEALPAFQVKIKELMLRTCTRVNARLVWVEGEPHPRCEARCLKCGRTLYSNLLDDHIHHQDQFDRTFIPSYAVPSTRGAEYYAQLSEGFFDTFRTNKCKFAREHTESEQILLCALQLFFESEIESVRSVQPTAHFLAAYDPDTFKKAYQTCENGELLLCLYQYCEQFHALQTKVSRSDWRHVLYHGESPADDILYYHAFDLGDLSQKTEVHLTYKRSMLARELNRWLIRRDLSQRSTMEWIMSILQTIKDRRAQKQFLWQTIEQPYEGFFVIR